MNLGDLIISPFIAILALLFKALAVLPGQMAGLNTVLAIALFALLIRLITLPLASQQQRSMEKAREIQPRLDDLRRRYANESEKLAQARMALYREAGINPLSGCLLTLMQLPFIFGLYSAITAALAGSPYQPFNLHGRVLITNLSGEIPLPNQFLWLNLAQPDLVLAILVIVTAVMQRRLSAKKEQVASTGWFGTYIAPLALGVMAATLLASGLSMFIIVFNLASVAQYAAMESVGLRRLFLGREKTRRWQLHKALKRRTLTPGQFDKLASRLLQPPELSPDDITLSVKFLELGASNFGEAWPVELAEKAGKVLSRLSLAGKMPHDLGVIYHKFAEGCLKRGYKARAADLAAQGYACPQSGPGAKTACVLLLARAELVDQRAKNIYKAFLADYPADSSPVQNFARIFQDKGAIAPDIDAATVRQRMPLNACLAELLPGKPYSWAKCNLGLAHLILDEMEQAPGYFQDALASNISDSIAAQGLAIVLFRMKQYDKSLQVIQNAREAGLAEAALDAIEGVCRAARWLADVQVKTSELEQIEMGYAQLQVSFPLRRFLASEAEFVHGRLAAITGDWENARRHLQAAYGADKDSVMFAYHYAQWLQISGEWETATKILKGKKPNSPELMCLRLKQAKHNVGLDRLDQEFAPFADDLEAKALKRLVSAKYALLTGRAADIPPWPAEVVFETPEQADEWVATWLSALIGRAAANEAQQEIQSKQFLRLPKPEQLFLGAAAKWISGDLAGAEREIRKSLKIAPNHENALRLLAAIMETQGDPTQSYQLLARLQQVAPNDHHAALRGALLRWQKGEEAAAIAQVQKLLSSPMIEPLARFWLGRLFLIRAARSLDPIDVQQAGECLQWAAEAGIPEAPLYCWLCEARKEYNPKTGWGQQGARQLLEALPGPLTTIPIAEVAILAALVAVETNNPADMLDGCTLLLSQLRDKRDKKAVSVVSLENWTESLWRTATTVTSLNDRLALSKLAHQVGESCTEHGRVARQIADATVMSTVTALAQSGENVDEALAQVEAAIEITPDALIPRLARTSLLIKKGEMTAQEAIAYLSQESRPAIAQALEECVQLTAGAKPTPSRPAGLAAFLIAYRTDLPRFASTLQTLSVETLSRQDEAFLLEMARCSAAVDLHDDAIELFSQAYEAGRTHDVAKEFSNYLCYVTARSGMPDTAETSRNLEKAQRLLSLAHTYSMEDTG